MAAGRLDHLRDPVARSVRGIGPLQHHHAGAVAGRDARADRGDPRPQRLDPRGCLGAAPDGPSDGLDRGEHLGDRVRIHGQDVRGAAQVVQCVVHHGDVDGTDRAEVLGQHEVGVQRSQRTLVQPVEVAASKCGADERVDLRWGETRRHGRGRHDPTRARLRGEVALERHPDDILTGADAEGDLGRGRQKRDDAHATSVPRSSVDDVGTFHRG